MSKLFADKKRLFLLLICGFITFWGCSLIRCELLSYFYGDDFDDVPIQYLVGNNYHKRVLDISAEDASVYYVSEDKSIAIVAHFSKKSNEWHYVTYECIWSVHGSADGTIWPYWWHFFYAHPQL